MVEWYRVGDDMAAGMGLLSDLCVVLLGTPAAQRLSYAAAFERFAGVDPHTASIEQLSARRNDSMSPFLPGWAATATVG